MLKGYLRQKSWHESDRRANTCIRKVLQGPQKVKLTVYTTLAETGGINKPDVYTKAA